MENELATTGNQPLTLDQKITAATELLAPVSPDLIAATLIRMRNAGLDFSAGIDPRRAADVYTFAMRGVCKEGFKRATAKIIQGDVPEVSGFIPKPPTFAALARSESASLWRDRERLLLTQESLGIGREQPVKTEEAKAKVRAMVQAVKDRAKAEQEERRDALYEGKTEDELNRLFRNKVFPPDEPAAGKWDDDAWHSQQRNDENGEENIRYEDLDQGEHPG